MTKLKDKLLKKTTIAGSSFIDESIYFNAVEFTKTPLLAMNLILSGKIDGGLAAGATTIAGESRTFKTLFGLILMKAYMKKHEDAIVLFYDSEFGAKPAYLRNFGIDTSRVLHIPIKNIEEWKFDLINKLEDIDRDDNIFIFVDSVGNLASKKELQDALDEKSVADMTRAKQLKSVGRMVTPYLTMKNVPMVMIGHTYKTQEMFSRDVVSGGTGIMYISDNILLITKSKIKDGTEKAGNVFTVKTEKSRFVREEMKVRIPVRFGEKLSPLVGMFDLAVELGYLRQPKKGWWSRVFDNSTDEDKNHRRKDVEFDTEFWTEFFQKSHLANSLTEKYSLEQLDMLEEEDVAEE